MAASMMSGMVASDLMRVMALHRLVRGFYVMHCVLLGGMTFVLLGRMRFMPLLCVQTQNWEGGQKKEPGCQGKGISKPLWVTGSSLHGTPLWQTICQK